LSTHIRGLRVLAGLGLAAILAGAAVGPVKATDGALGEAAARQLLTRAGFAPNRDEVAAVAPLTQAQAVDRLLAAARRQPQTPAPEWIDDTLVFPRELQRMSEDERRAYRQTLVRQSLELRGWWLREMAATPSPLTERMTLFWHNHFVSAQPKVRWPQPLYWQNLLLREHALGSFGALAHAIVRDPALLIYLDGATSRRGQPNENLARELMELFMIGPGHYTEADVKQAARAFTGYSIDPATGRFLYRRFAHDGGAKTVLGKQGEFTGDDIVDLLLAQPATAEFVVAKLWREFVSPQPDPARLARIAADFRNSGYAIPVALRELLNQPEVVSADPEFALVKSPVELVIGLVRQSGGELRQPIGAALAAAAMGQNLFGAPNVRGWPGGEAWINTQTLLARKQFIDRAMGGTPRATEMAMPPAASAIEAAAQSASQVAADSTADRAAEAQARRRQQLAQQAIADAVRIDGGAWLKSAAGLMPERALAEADIERLAARLGAVAPVSPPGAGTLGLDALRALLLDPAYQLK
jgi:uncharacterized protein (DUF1800 family)